MTRRAYTKSNIVVPSLVAMMLGIGFASILQSWARAEEPVEERASVNEDAPRTEQEARTRARLLHETIHGALQVMHRDLFREDESPTIPSRSLEDVFAELTRSHNVKVRWLAVNTDAMNVDHKPQSEFEKHAVQALASGKPSYEQNVGGVYRYAGTIRLASQCLKCHVPNRTSTEDRAAGLVISMPLFEQDREKP